MINILIYAILTYMYYHVELRFQLFDNKPWYDKSAKAWKFIKRV